MVILPAIDIIKGNCVRLTKGDFKSSKKYFNDPVAVAEMWESMGASWLHVVDLDGARAGFPENLGIAAKIKSKTGLKVEFGGGIRRIKVMDEVIAAGMDRAIIGTAALEDRNFLDSAMEKYKEKIIISVDFDSKGIIYTRGWQQGTPYSIEEFLPLLKHSGINEIIITNITKDGTLSGPDTRLIRKVLDVSGLDLIIAGGITCIEDIKKLKKLESRGVTGVIIGKALYEEKISLIEAIDAGR
jgi:phosphoribosylformimino-5-aminoimidazole carboxamide ribotide isomerase